MEARFLEVELRLHRWPHATDHEYVDWRAEVGFVTPWRPLYPILLGQHGFLNQFTVTTSRTAQELTIENVAAYDDRFPQPGS